MNKAPAYQHYPDKWITDTRRLSWASKGIYRELLDVIWTQFQDTCSIPDDDAFISSELGCTADEWVTAKKEIQNEFRPLLVVKRGKLHSKGLFKEHTKQVDRRQKLSENGKKGGRPTHKAIGKQLVNSEKQLPSLPSPSPSSTPTVVNNKAKKVISSDATELAQDLLDRTSKALKRNLISDVAGSSKPIQKLLDKGIPCAEILNTITWLTTDNLKSEYKYDVLSGSGLLKKWDKVQSAMTRNKKPNNNAGKGYAF